MAKPKRTSVPITDGRRLRRHRTEEKLVAALGTVLRREGVAGLGINAIAAEAEVEKVLIYRYFGGLEGLMEAYGARSDFWPSLEELVGKGGEVLRDPDKPRAGARVLLNYARALRKRPLTLDLLAWECTHRNPLTVALEKVREAQSDELARLLVEGGVITSEGEGQVGTLFAAAINYLAVRGRELKVFGGLPIAKDADWERLGELIESVLRGLRAQRDGSGLAATSSTSR
ncbi:MAG: TetR/AcrR family transcriptional regulator [Deltaproteobacteria bacterium]|nr:TetR/AcrR family transcriptional regulator [Deltaproteobacteria bacterium]